MSGARHRFTVLGCVALGLGLMFARPLHAETPEEIQRMIAQEAVNHRVPVALAMALAKVESNFNERAESPVGARGVMQIMPKTARDEFGVGADFLWNARLNIQLGLRFLTQLYQMYGQRWDLALSHYNGGSLRGGSGAAAIPHDYTRQYVADVQRWQQTYAKNGFVNVGNPSRPNKPRPKGPFYTGPRWGTALPGHAWQPGVRIDPLEFQAWAERARQRLDNRLVPEDRQIR